MAAHGPGMAWRNLDGHDAAGAGTVVISSSALRKLYRSRYTVSWPGVSLPHQHTVLGSWTGGGGPRHNEPVAAEGSCCI